MKRLLFVLLLLFITAMTLGAQPTYQLILKNDSLVSDKIYEFDMFIVRTGDTALELGTLQAALTFNTGISSGSVSFTINNGSSDLNPAQTPSNGQLSVVSGELQMLASADPGSGNGTTIPTDPGARVGRFRVTSSVSFSNAKANLTWKNSGLPPVTKVQTYDVLDHLLEITDSAHHLVSLQNSTLSPLVITTASLLPAGTNTVAYAETLAATGGTLPYSWSLASGSLPGGISLSSDGSIGGTTASTGTFPFTAKVNDSASDSTTKSFSLTINPFVYSITASAGANGSISPNGLTSVNYGTDKRFTFSPATGHHLDSLIVDGVQNTDSLTGYTFKNVTANHTIRVVFAITQYTITPSAGGNGTISPSAPVVVNYGGSQLFSITPLTGYHVDSLIVDGVKITSDTTYTFTGIAANHTIRGTFAINQYAITASSGPNGSISPSGVVNANNGSNQQFTITPNTGYHLDSLIVDGLRNVDSTTSYTFVNVTASHTIRVTFAPNTLSITVTSIPVGLKVKVDGGPYQTTPYSTSWTAATVHTILVDSIQGDTASRTLYRSWSDAGAISHTVTPLVNTTYTATFQQQYYLKMAANAGGTATPSSAWYNKGDTVILTGAPSSSKYQFSTWSGALYGGGTGSCYYNGGLNPVTLTMDCSMTEIANFARSPFQIVVESSPIGKTTFKFNGNSYTTAQTSTISNPPQQIFLDIPFDPQPGTPGVQYAWVNWNDGGGQTHAPIVDSAFTYIANFKTQFNLNLVAGPGGSVAPPAGYQDSGAVVPISATPTTGYTFSRWSGNGTGSYTGINPTPSLTIGSPINDTAYFTLSQYTITASNGINGTISPSGAVGVTHGANQQFTITPSTGHHLDSLIVDGVRNTDSTTSYTFVNITANHTIRVVFAINQYTITPSAGSNGTISPSAPVVVNYGGSQLFSFTPSTGYHVDSAFVDGAYVTNATSYTVTSVTANHTINVTFAINQFTITATSGANGTVLPTGTTSANYGASQLYSIRPNTGYHVDSLIVDGVKITSDTTYTFTGIATNHTIRGTFAPNTLSITVTSIPVGLKVKVDGGPYQTTPYSTSWTAATVHTILVDSIQGDTASRTLYRSWSDAGAISHMVTPLVNTTYTATFQQQYYLKMAANAGGTATPSSGWYNKGDTVILTGTPSSSKYQFSTWSGALYGGGTGSCYYNGGLNPVTLTMDCSMTEIANFARSPFQIVIESFPSGKTTFSYGGSNFNTLQTSTISNPPQQIFLGIPFDPQPGTPGVQYAWVNWNDGGGKFHAPIADSAFTYIAFFKTQFNLNLVAGPGGSVAPPAGYQDSGAVVPISATPTTGYTFSRWSGNGTGSYTGINPTPSLTIGSPINDTAYFALDTMIITASSGANGSIAPSGSVKVPYGSNKTFTITPNATYHVSDVVVDGSSVGPDTVYTFTNVITAHTITASFTQNGYTITASAGPNGTITPSGPVPILSGGSQTFSIHGNTGYHVDSILVDNISKTPDTTYSFTNVTANHTIRAVFAPDLLTITFQTVPAGRTVIIDTTHYVTPKSVNWTAGSLHTISVDTLQNGTPGTRYSFTTWSDTTLPTHNVSPLVNTTYTASFGTQYSLTLKASAGGATAANPPGPWFASGSSVNISATTTTGYVFSSWTGAGAGSYTGTANPGPVTMNAPVTDSATFTLKQLNVTIQSNPSGRSVIVDLVTYTTPHTFTTWNYGQPHTINTTTPQSVSSTLQYIFKSWSDSGTMSHAVSPVSDTTYTVNFTTQFLLTTAAATGGTVVPPSGFYDSAAVVNLTATAGYGYQFSSWAGSGAGSYTGINNPASVTMDGPVKDTAKFGRYTAHLTVRTIPPGLQILVDDTLYNSPRAFSWTTGSSHKITLPDTQAGVAGTRYVWNSWSDGGTKLHNVTPLSDTSFTANLTTQFYLTMNSNVGGTASPPSGWYDSSKHVTLTATPGVKYNFYQWAGIGSGAINSSNAVDSVTMNGPINETPNFVRKQITITFQTSPPGRQYTINGNPFSTPFIKVINPGDAVYLNTNQVQPDPIRPTLAQYVWTSWSDGGWYFHTAYPDTDMTITAFFKTQFMVTTAAGPGGTVAPPSGWQDSSSVDTLIATPNPGYALQQWFGSGPGSYSGVANNVPITVGGPITDSATFSHFPINVTIQSSPAGRVTIVDGVTDSAATRHFIWTASSVHTIGIADTQYSGPGTRYFWTSWSDGGAKTHSVSPLRDTIFTVNFQPQYFLTMNTGSGGTVTPSNGWYNGGQQVVITGIPNLTYNFGQWNGIGAGSYTGPKNPDTISVNGPITETASFTLVPVHITIQTVPAGLSISVDSIIYTAPQNFTWNLGSQHSIQAVTPQNVVGTTRNAWKSWSDNGAAAHTITPVKDSVYVATFTTQYLLTAVADSGGTVTPGTSWQDSGATVQLTAHSGPGYSFTNWRGSGTGSYTGPQNPITVSMKGAIYDTAGFSRFQANVSIVTNPPGLHVLVNGGSFPTPYSAQWTTGAIHTITAVDTQAGPTGTRYIYLSWSDSGARLHDVTALRDTTFTANFTTQYFLTDSANTGGTVTPVSNWYNSGQNVILTAIPNNGYSFQRWTGTGTGSFTGNTNPVTITVNSPITEVGSFNQNPFIVNVHANPSGRSFIVGGTTYNTPQTFQVTPGTNFYLDAPTPQAIGPGAQYAWLSWSDSGTKGHTASALSDTTFVVNFILQYDLTTTSSPPSGGTTNPPSQTFFNVGDTAVVTAVANAHFAFLNWTGDGFGTANPIRIPMTSPKNLNANFSAGLQVTVTADSVGRSVLIDDSAYTAPAVVYWLAGSSHKLSTPSPQSGITGVRYAWRQWSDLGTLTHNVSTTRDTSFTARFQTQYYLTMTGGAGGTISPASGWYPKDTTVAISATSDSGYALIDWNGSGSGSYSGISNPVNVTLSRPIGETARFGKILSPPTLLAVDSNATNVSATPLLRWQSYPSVTSYRLQVANDSLFANLVVNASPLTDTTYQVPALGNQMAYFWRVNAIVGPDITKFSSVWKFTTLTATITAASPIENWGTRYTYPVSWSSTQLSGNVNIRLSTDNGTSWRTIKNNIPNSGSIFWTVPDTQHLSALCKYRVESTLNPAIYNESVTFAIVFGVLPPSVRLSTSVVYPGTPASTDYRMVSLPGVADTFRLGTIVTGEQKLDWRAFSDNGLATNYLTELDRNFHFTTGEGIWLVKKGNLNLTNFQMVMPALDTILARLAIPLHTGWNIIGNPFDKDVQWSDVLALNALPPTTPLTLYNGSYGSSTAMSPFGGYYFLNDSGWTTLQIPYPFGSVVSSHGRPEPQWTIQLILQSASNSDPENYAGIAAAVKKGKNALTFHKPPFFMEQAYLYFPHPEWDTKYPFFSSDIRPDLGEGQSWNFEVHNPAAGAAAIRAGNISSLPAGTEAVLINLSNSQPYDLRLHPVYGYTTISAEMQFRLLVGSKAYVEREVGKLMPQSYELEQNFPNPFNPTTSISIKLPKQSNIRLEIYSILGQKVKTVAEGDYQRGIYTFVWDGTDERNSRVATGVYLYRLMANGGMVQTKKMILAK